jgi:hypothetical protein
MRFDNVWRLSTAQALAVASVGGAELPAPLSARRPMQSNCAFPARHHRPVDAVSRL